MVNGLWLTAVLAASATGSAPANGPTAPALVGGTPITTAELDVRFAAQAAQREQAYAAQERRLRLQHEREVDAARRALLESMIDERVLLLEAKAQGTSPDAVLAAVTVPTVTDEDVQAASVRARRGQGESDADFLARVRQQLEKDAHAKAERGLLQRLGAQYDVRLQLEPRREVVPIDDSPVRGPADARVTIVEFADFQCPFCLRVEPTLHRVLEEHPRDVRLVFKQLPIQELHADALRLARGAVCAQSQGKFWEFHDAVFANPGRIDPTKMSQIAQGAGVDGTGFESCLAGTTADGVIARDVDEANALIIGGTPALFVNGRMIQGAPSYETLTAMVDQELVAKSR